MYQVKNSLELLTTLIHYTDTGINNQFVKPDEDYAEVKNNYLFSVFDGVTLLYKNPYPDPSPAKLASQLAISSIFEYIEEYENLENVDVEKILFDGFIYANSQIREFNFLLGNTEETVDNLQTQYAATVGIVGILKQNNLFLAHINDCSATIFNENNNYLMTFATNTSLHDKYFEYISKLNKISDPIMHHKCIRDNIVNKNIVFEDQNLNFGVMNGDSKVSNFIKTIKLEIKRGYKILLYSDGFIPLCNNEEFINFILHNGNKNILDKYIKDLNLKMRYDKEKTLIRIEII